MPILWYLCRKLGGPLYKLWAMYTKWEDLKYYHFCGHVLTWHESHKQQISCELHFTWHDGVLNNLVQHSCVPKTRQNKHKTKNQTPTTWRFKFSLPKVDRHYMGFVLLLVHSIYGGMRALMKPFVFEWCAVMLDLRATTQQDTCLKPNGIHVCLSFIKRSRLK